MSKISIIVPVYYNADTLMLLYRDMQEKIFKELGDYEIVFVDDGSGDDSWKIINEIRELDENVKGVRLSRNFGEHAAILAGLSNCSGDCAVTKQADLQEDSELILRMYESRKQGCYRGQRGKGRPRREEVFRKRLLCHRPEVY